MEVRSESLSALSQALAKVDETIAKSKQVLGSSLDYMHGKKPNFQDRIIENHFPAHLDDSSEMELSSDSCPRPSGTTLEAGFAALQKERDSLEQQISAMTSRLKSEVTQKHTYEKTVGELRDRVAELESRDSEPAGKVSARTREAVLERKAEEQAKRIRELERMLSEEAQRGDREYLREIQDLKGVVERLTRENQKLEALAAHTSRDESPYPSRLDLIEQRLSSLDSRCRAQFCLTEQLQTQLHSFCSSPCFTDAENTSMLEFEEQLRQSQSQIDQLEEKLRMTVEVYEELRAVIETTQRTTRPLTESSGDSQTVTPRTHSAFRRPEPHPKSKPKLTTPRAPRASKRNP